MREYLISYPNAKKLLRSLGELIENHEKLIPAEEREKFVYKLALDALLEPEPLTVIDESTSAEALFQ